MQAFINKQVWAVIGMLSIISIELLVREAALEPAEALLDIK